MHAYAAGRRAFVSRIAGDKYAALAVAAGDEIATLPRIDRKHFVSERTAGHPPQEQIGVLFARGRIENREPPQLAAVDRDQLRPAAGFVDDTIETRPALV